MTCRCDSLLAFIDDLEGLAYLDLTNQKLFQVVTQYSICKYQDLIGEHGPYTGALCLQPVHQNAFVSELNSYSASHNN